ncbi:MAG TPA: MFS transporter [Actinotalea sp.]|nr:MFS transporter [Actinotalea sp.]
MSAVVDRRHLVLGIYLPVVVYEAGIGAVLPVVALSATALGASIAQAGVVVALLAIGQLLGDAPAGALAARVGDRRAMLLAAGASVLALTAAALASSVLVLGAALVLLGAVNSVVQLARHSYLTATTPVGRRARVLSTLAGLHRIGLFLGPFIGAALVHVAGLSAAYWFAVGAASVTALLVLLVPDGVRHERPTGGPSTLAVLREHRDVFRTLGLAVLLVGAARGGRVTVLPLWSEHLGLSPATTSVIFGVSGAVDMLLFYPAGRLMDVRGRLWTAIPSMAVLGVGFAVLPLTTTAAGVAVAAVVIGLGNGMGSGILMTIGADVAPSAVRAQFLGLWRLCQDLGGAGGPLLVAGGAALGSLAAGIFALAGVCGGSVVALARWTPRYSVHANRGTRRRAVAAGLLDPPPDGSPS